MREIIDWEKPLITERTGREAKILEGFEIGPYTVYIPCVVGGYTHYYSASTGRSPLIEVEDIKNKGE